METQNQENRVRKEVEVKPLVVARVHATTYQKEGTLTAEIKQTIETKSFYPSKSVVSNFQDNPFSVKDFGFRESDPYISSETRVAWVPVPVTSTVETVVAQLAKLPEANIYRILANKPIISEPQQYAIDNKLTTLDIIADKQVLRYPVGAEKAGQLILDKNGKPQYKANFFKSVKTADVDSRTEDPADYYATPLIKQQMGALAPSIAVAQETL